MVSYERQVRGRVGAAGAPRSPRQSNSTGLRHLHVSSILSLSCFNYQRYLIQCVCFFLLSFCFLLVILKSSLLAATSQVTHANFIRRTNYYKQLTSVYGCKLTHLWAGLQAPPLTARACSSHIRSVCSEFPPQTKSMQTEKLTSVRCPQCQTVSLSWGFWVWLQSPRYWDWIVVIKIQEQWHILIGVFEILQQKTFMTQRQKKIPWHCVVYLNNDLSLLGFFVAVIYFSLRLNPVTLPRKVDNRTGLISTPD